MAGEEAILCNHYDGFTLQQLFEQVNGGPGTPAVEQASSALDDFAPVLTSSGDRLQHAMNQAKVTWQGQAAEAAGSAVTQMTRWADSGGQVTQTGGRSVHDYTSSWASMKAKIPPPKPVPPASFWGDVADLFGANSDHAVAVQENENARRTAIAAMQAHENGTRATAASFHDLQPVPRVVTNAASTQTAAVTSGGPGGGTSPAGGGASAAPGGSSGMPVGGAGDAGSSPTGTGSASHLPLPPVGPSTKPTHSAPGMPGGTGGSSTSGKVDPASMPPLPSQYQYRPGAIQDALEPNRSLAQRGTSNLAEPRAATTTPATAAAAVKGSPTGMPMGASGAGAGKPEERDHRNNVFIPTNEHFYAEDDHDVVPAVITAEYLEQVQEQRR